MGVRVPTRLRRKYRKKVKKQYHLPSGHDGRRRLGFGRRCARRVEDQGLSRKEYSDSGKDEEHWDKKWTTSSGNYMLTLWEKTVTATGTEAGDGRSWLTWLPNHHDGVARPARPVYFHEEYPDMLYSAGITACCPDVGPWYIPVLSNVPGGGG